MSAWDASVGLQLLEAWKPDLGRVADRVSSGLLGAACLCL